MTTGRDDNKFNHVLSDSLKEQIAISHPKQCSNCESNAPFNSKQEEWTVDYLPLLLPTIYAALGENLGEVTFEQKNLRQHLVHCFEHAELPTTIFFTPDPFQ